MFTHQNPHIRRPGCYSPHCKRHLNCNRAVDQAKAIGNLYDLMVYQAYGDLLVQRGEVAAAQHGDEDEGDEERGKEEAHSA